MATALARPKAQPKTAQFPFHTYPLLVSPRQAREHSTEAEYPFQRPIRPYQVSWLRLLIEQGQKDIREFGYPKSGLRPGTVITFAVFRRTKQRYCINGNHTLRALGETHGPAYPLQFEEHLVDTEEEVSRLYQSYDRNLARSWKDLYRADSHLRQEDIPPQLLEKLGAVTQLLATGFAQKWGFGGRAWDQQLKNPYIRFALMYDWLKEARDFHTGLTGATGGTRKLLYRASVFAVALITYRFQPQLAHTFWPRLARDSGLSEGEPEWALLRYLRENTTRAIDPATYQRTVAAAWNVYFNRRVVSKLQPSPSTKPILIMGTPHDSSAHYAYLSQEGTVYHDPYNVNDVMPMPEEPGDVG